jgi:hypothetical protein
MTFATLFCRGQAPGPARFLDGPTVDGSVGLAPSTDDQFSGTGRNLTIEEGNIWTLECLGSIKNPAHVSLDGCTN